MTFSPGLRLLVLLAALSSCSSRSRPFATTRTLTRAVRHQPSHEVRSLSPSTGLYSIGVLGPASTRKLSSSLLRLCDRALSPWLRIAERWQSRTRRLLRWSAKRTIRSLNATAALTYRACNRTAAITFRACNRTAALTFRACNRTAALTYRACNRTAALTYRTCNRTSALTFRACNRTAALTYRACNLTATLLVVVPLRRTAAWLGLTAKARGARHGAGRGMRAHLSPSQCEVLDALQEELGRDHSGLARRARGAGMPLDDATLCRYLECAGWKVRAYARRLRARATCATCAHEPSAFTARVQRPIGVRRDS